MSDLKPYGTFPTPYGVPVPVYLPEAVNPDAPDHLLFDMDGTAIFAGIYDQGERARFVTDAQRLGRMPAFEEYGGQVVPKRALPAPRSPAYPRTADVGASPIEAWVTGTMDCSRWCDRAAFLINILGENMEQPSADPLTETIYPLALSVLMTGALEHLCETEIDCLEAAAIYALTEHEEWRRPAQAWLYPFRETWFRDWRNARPRYTAFARGLTEFRDLPRWLGETGGAA